MKLDLARYIRTPPGEMPDGYLLDGAHTTPISRVADAAELSPPILRAGVSGETPARFDALEVALAVAAVFEDVGRVQAIVSAVDDAIPHAIPRPPTFAEAECAALREMRAASAKLAAWRDAEERRHARVIAEALRE